jgi:hypothetical protein
MVVTACSHVLLKERRHRLEDEVEVVVREVIEVHADLRPRLAPKKAVVAAQGVDGDGHESKRVALGPEEHPRSATPTRTGTATLHRADMASSTRGFSLLCTPL